MNMTEVIRARIAHMKSLYELSGGVKHDGEMGAFREFFVAELVRPVLPHHFGVGSGVVVGKDGRQSPQLDVIIYDRRGVPPLLVAGDRGVYPIDSVLAACEVKSTLKAADYKQAGLAARHFHPSHTECLVFAADGPGGAAPVHPLYAVFGYTADAKEKPEPERLSEQLTDPNDRDTIRLITVLDKGLWIWNGAYEAEPHKERVGEMFVLHLLNRLEEAAKTRSPFRLQDWIT